MKKIYQVSLCKHGVLGGLLHVDQDHMMFCTNKLTVGEEIRRLKMPYAEIRLIERAPWHTIRVTMQSGKQHRLLVFSREKLMQQLGAYTSARA